jgi:ABC-type sulfate/molybdate transport systems ATPase subunit
MLFQENNLFNHLTIRQNIASGCTGPETERDSSPGAGDCRADGD